MARTSLWALVTLCAACSHETAATAARAPVEVRHRRAEELVLDVSSRGESLVGRALPVPEQSDADRVLAVRWLTDTGARAWRFADAQALEARFVPRSSSVLVLTTRHELLRLDRPDAEGVVLDRQVLGPLSLDAAGRFVVYARGEMPDYEVVRAELDTGRTLSLAPELVPAWCPTLTPDGREVLVVASPTGTPSLYRISSERRVERWNLPIETPLPTGPSAPLVLDGRLVYESDGALHTLALDGSGHTVQRGLGLPVQVPGANAVLAHDRSARITLLSLRELERSR